MITRPLLAVASEDITKLSYPVYCTPKYDGIRCLKVDNNVVTRNFKPQPNRYIRDLLSILLPNGVDGELVLTNMKSFNEVQSAIMSYEGQPDFEYHIFDYVSNDLMEPYLERMENLNSWYNNSRDKVVKKRIKIVNPIRICNEEELISYEQQCLAQGFEGVMIRSGSGKYKCGRSTLKEGILLKLKRFLDSEAEIVGFEEKFHNENEKEKNELGLSKRATKKANLIPADTLGALLVKDLKTDIEFSVGTGYDDELRKQIWNNKEEYLGEVIKYKYQPSGAKDKPRFPVFLGFRSRDDF